ncbi:adenylyltransferase/cytidyltransferase family protein [bacterium SCSIO 12741]|nr:adenylyltransferase/cytidyltransferase family protein [bacterium SCSIO 12741]
MKVGFACGVYDLFHAGHVLMLQECREHCDYLVLGLNRAENIDPEINPGKKPPVYSFEERKLILENSRYVDEVIGYNSEEELMEIMKERQFDVRFLGDDYRGRPITGPDLAKSIYYTNRDHGYSTTEVKNRVVEHWKPAQE